MKNTAVRFILFTTLTFMGMHTAAASNSDSEDIYLYRQTQELVDFVEEAADLLEKKGPAAFDDYKNNPRWANEKYYLFVYDINGIVLYHPIEPTFVGKNLMELKDMNGKPVIKMITDIGKQPGNRASGWIFYLWEERIQFNPEWKSSYIRKVVGPDNKIYLIGSGSYDIPTEKIFVKDVVDKAAKEIETKGLEVALKEFRDPALPYYFLGEYVYVLDMNGHMILDPAFPTLTGRDFSQFRDDVGQYVVKNMIEKLRFNDSAWIQFMWHKEGGTNFIRKLAYVRKVKVGNDYVIVGSNLDLLTPIWMKN